MSASTIAAHECVGRTAAPLRRQARHPGRRRDLRGDVRLYGYKQPVGLTSNIINTAANKGALLALVAMAQTMPVLTGGIDLSVGMIFLLTNCLASVIVNGDPIMTTLGVIGVLLAGTACGALNGVIVVYGRLQPIIVTLATSALFYGLALILRPQPGGSVNPDLADFMTRSTYWVPVFADHASGCRAVHLDPVQALGPRPRRLCHRLVGAGGVYVGRRRSARRSSSPTRCRACSRRSPACC